MIQTGNSINFIDSFQEYKEQNKINYMNIIFHSRNMSLEFANSTDIIEEQTHDKSSYHKVNKLGGSHTLIKIFDPFDLMYKNYIQNKMWNRFNFGNYFNIAKSKNLLEKKNSDIKLNTNFFISVDDGIVNELLFGSKSKYGHIIEVDSYVSYNYKSTYTKKYEIYENKMIVNTDYITTNQQQRRSLGTDIGFMIINNPGGYVSSLNLRGIRVYLTRRNEAGDDIPVIQ